MDQIADVEGTAAVPDIARGVQCDAGESRFDGQPLVSGRFALNDDTTTRRHDDTTTRRRTTEAPSAQAPRNTKLTKLTRKIWIFSSTDYDPLAVPRFARCRSEARSGSQAAREGSAACDPLRTSLLQRRPGTAGVAASGKNR